MKEELYKLHTLIYIWMGINQNISNRFFKLMVWRLLLHTTNIQCFFFHFIVFRVILSIKYAKDR